MKTITNKSIALVLFFSFFAVSAFAIKRKDDKKTAQWKYEVECMGTGAQGTYLIKVWSYSKKPHLAIEQAKKNAVHGIVFKGFVGGQNGCHSQKPLVKDVSATETHKGFFKDFFKNGGDYMKFINVTNDGQVAAGDRMKMKRKGYKIGVVVSVNKDQLRKYLEDKSIIRGLSTGF